MLKEKGYQMSRSNSEALTRLGLLFVLLSSVITAAALVHPAWASSGQQIVHASVFVICPYAVSVTPNSPVFVIPTNIVLFYSANTLADCSIPSASGTVNVINYTTSSVLFTDDVTLTGITNTVNPTRYTFQTPSTYAMQGEDNGIFTLTSGPNTISSSTTPFYVIRPANIILSNFTISPSSSRTGSTITFTSNVYNDGQLAANNVVLNLKVNEPGGGAFLTVDPLLALSPGQSQVVSLQLGTVSGTPGQYTATENVSFNSIYVYGSTTYSSPTLYSSNATAGYTISSPPGPKPPVTNITNYTTPVLPSIAQNAVEITTAPMYIQILRGNSSLQYLGFKNNLNSSVWLNFTIPEQQIAQQQLHLSTNSLYLAAHSAGLIQYVLSPFANTSPGTYVAQVNITLSVQDSMHLAPATSSLYTKLNVMNPPHAPYIRTTALLLNASTAVEEQFTLSNPTNETYYNLELQAPIPSIALYNDSQISLLGNEHSIIPSGASLVLGWKISTLQPGDTSVLTSTINRIAEPQLFTSPAVSLSAPSQPKPAGVFRVLFINALPVYLNSTGSVEVESIYTGTNVTNTTFNFVPPPGQQVQNPFRHFELLPNQVLTTTYTIGPLTQAGTLLYTLNINGYFGQETYAVPVIVSPPPTTIPVLQPPSPYNVTIAGVLLGIAMVVIIFTIYYLRRFSRRGPSYSKARAEKLRNISKRIREEM